MPDHEPPGITIPSKDDSFQPNVDIIDQNKVVSEFRNKFRGMQLFAHTPRDCSPALFKPEITSWNKVDFDKGILDPQDKLNLVVEQNIGELWTALRNSDVEIDGELSETIYKFSNHDSIFIPVDGNKVNENIVVTAKTFGADKTGMILKIGSINKQEDIASILIFPAVTKDGKNYRILQAKAVEELEVLQHAFDLISLPTVFLRSGDNFMAFMEFVDSVEHPGNITQAEMDDWLHRVGKSSVEFELDIGKTDNFLDNLVRHKGKLYWCDANLMGARAVDKQRAIEVVDDHRATLQRFVQ